MGKSTIILLLVGLSIQLILAQAQTGASSKSKEASNRKLKPISEDDEIPMAPSKPSPPTDTKAPIEKRQIGNGYSNTRGGRGNWGGGRGGWGGNYGGGFGYGGGRGGPYRPPYGGYGFYGPYRPYSRPLIVVG